MTGPLPAPGRTGVRIGGDHYQWLIAWSGCLTALYDDAARPANPVVAVEVEATAAGNLDDVVLRRAAPPHTYSQVKYAVDAASPVNTDWLTRPSASGGPGLLAKTTAAWRKLSADGAPADLAIVTNRSPDPGDILVSGRDSRTGLLLPTAGEQTSRSARGRARAAWARAVGLGEEELLQLLGVLRFDLALDLAQVERMVSLQMLVCGLRGDADAVRAGADWIASQVRASRTSIDVPAIEVAVDQLGLRVDRAWTVLSVATLTPDPLADEAAYALDWVDRFDGDDPYSRRSPRLPATWQQLQADLENIPARLPGVPRVAVTGSIRQAAGFTIGAALRMVTGVEVAVVQRDQLWTSTADYTTPLRPHQESFAIGAGEGLAVAVEVATPIADDVRDYLEEAGIGVARLIALSPPAGPKDNAIADAAAANAFAVGLRDAIRKALRGHRQVHLFLAGPMGLSLLLGHRWNRLAPTTVYEDLGAAVGYGPAFTVTA